MLIHILSNWLDENGWDQLYEHRVFEKNFKEFSDILEERLILWRVRLGNESLKIEKYQISRSHPQTTRMNDTEVLYSDPTLFDILDP